MGKTYEAITKAEKEYGATFIGASPPSKVIAKTPTRETPFHRVDKWYRGLKTSLLSYYPAHPIKTIAFTGIARGDGASTTAFNFATSLLRDRRLKVLLVDANLKDPSLHEVFGIDYTHGLTDLLTKRSLRAFPINNVGPGKLFLLPCGAEHCEAAGLFENSQIDHFFKLVRNRFDYIIVDTPAFIHFPEWRVLCAKVDGVVLIIDAGNTKRQVGIRAKKELEEVGANILGVVLNKKKYYIPEWIYKRL